MTPRPFTAEDAESVAALVRALNAEEGYDPARSPDAATLCDAFLGARAIGRLLVLGAPPVGYLTLHPCFATTHGSRGAFMGDLYVARAHRRQGLARALVAAAAATVRAEGGRFLEWTALPGNAGGAAFYAAIGAEGETLQVHSLDGAAFATLADTA